MQNHEIDSKGLSLFGGRFKVRPVETPFAAVRRFHGIQRRLEEAQDKLVKLSGEDSFTNGIAIAEQNSEVNDLERRVKNGPGITTEIVLFDRHVLFFDTRPSKDRRYMRMARETARIAQRENDQFMAEFTGEEMPSEVVAAIEINERVARG